MFIASKLLSALTQPMFWLALWWLAALLLLNRFPKNAVRMLWFGFIILILLGFRAIPDALLRPLENRYPIPSAESLANHAGVIVLGGALEHPEVFMTHGQVGLNSAAERMTVPVALLRQYPHFELLFSGGEGRLMTTGVSEATLAQVFFQQQGIPLSRMRLESRSRNTRENAEQVAKLLEGNCQKPWLLVTSAWHMPRAMHEFEKLPNASCAITPYPVDFLTGASTAISEYSLAISLLRWQVALHEWLGLWVYRQ